MDPKLVEPGFGVSTLACVSALPFTPHVPNQALVHPQATLDVFGGTFGSWSGGTAGISVQRPGTQLNALQGRVVWPQTSMMDNIEADGPGVDQGCPRVGCVSRQRDLFREEADADGGFPPPPPTT